MIDESAQGEIQRLDYEINEEQNKLKTVTEQIKQLKEDLPEYKEFQNAEATFMAARTRLKNALESDGQYTKLCEDKAQLAAKLRDLKDILSNYVTRYWKETEEQQVLLSDGKSAKQVIITGKLGKTEAYQERML